MVQRSGRRPELKRAPQWKKQVGWSVVVAAGLLVGALAAVGVHGLPSTDGAGAGHPSSRPVAAAASHGATPKPAVGAPGHASASGTAHATASPKPVTVVPAGQRVVAAPASVVRAALATKGKAVAAVSAPPIPLTTTSSPVPGAEISIAGLSAVSGSGKGVGMINGPSLLFHVVVRNAESKPESLAGIAVNLYYGTKLTPALELNDSRSSAMPASVAPGSSAAGTYVFKVPASDRAKVRITVNYAVGTPVSVFDGAAPAK